MRYRNGRGQRVMERIDGRVMSQDISSVLESWSLDEPAVRLIDGDDGRKKLQRRLALGILQLEIDGRPDGMTPHGYPSYLDFYRHESERESFSLAAEDCQKLAAEAILYFQRRMCFFDLGDFERAARDAERNLAAFAFARQHAHEAEDAWMLDQYRGFVLTHRARARALDALSQKDLGQALSSLEAGFHEIQEFLDEYEIDEEMAAGGEIRQLRDLQRSIQRRQDELGQDNVRVRLEIQLRRAVRREEYERAAEIRDRLRALPSHEA